MTNYVVATIKPWNMMGFFAHTVKFPGSWELVTDQKHLVDVLPSLNPRYIFFPHWSWSVQSEIIAKYECVCFHMTDLPFGRGGSPLQNLISRGFTDTALTAFRMTERLDDGPFYLKRPLSLAGRAEEIYVRASELIYEMMEEIVRNNPIPVEQQGEPVFFSRRKPEESALPEKGSIKALYDHIRMSDAPTYPLAFLDHGDWRIEFHHAEQVDGIIETQAIIRRR